MTNKKQAGFTIIELLLAMAFIAFMILFVVLAIIQSTKLYSKGLAISQINQTGQQVMVDVNRSIRYSTPMTAPNRLCLGGVSYLWNTDAELNPGPAVNTFSDSTSELRLVSVSDAGGRLCIPPYNSITRGSAKDLVGGDITVLDFSVQQRGKMWDITFTLSTRGNDRGNMAVPNGSGGFECSPQNQFCAFGEFDTSVYSRGGVN